MKYEIKLDDVILTNEVLNSVDIDILQIEEEKFVNNKNKIEINIKGNIYSKDNENMKNIEIIKKIISLKDKYFDVNIKIDEIEYFLPKLYIHKLKQKFEIGEGYYEIKLFQKFIGDETEIKVSENK